MTTMQYVEFASWFDVLLYASRHATIWYQAPLDTRPTLCDVVRVYKNGKIRLSPYSADADAFTADIGHRERMRRERDTCPLCGEDRNHPSQILPHECNRR